LLTISTHTDIGDAEAIFKTEKKLADLKPRAGSAFARMFKRLRVSNSNSGRHSYFVSRLNPNVAASNFIAAGERFNL
jgi:hypothetical protein